MDLPERPSTFKYAFSNVYNVSLLGGALAASVATGDWGVAVIAAGLEALWLFIGADTAPFKRWVNHQHAQKLAAAAKEKRRVRILGLTDKADRARAIELVTSQLDMLRESQQSEKWSSELVRDEVARLESLLDGFVDLAEAAERFEDYGAKYDPARLRKELDAQRRLAAQGTDGEARDLARKNAELLVKRIETLQDMDKLVQRSRGQMSVIENTVRLLRDQIVSMQPPQDVKGQLDEISAGVDAVRTVLSEGEARVREAEPWLAEGAAGAESEPGSEPEAPAAQRQRVRQAPR